jgi:hypothetical protein
MVAQLCASTFCLCTHTAQRRDGQRVILRTGKQTKKCRDKDHLTALLLAVYTHKDTPTLHAYTLLLLLLPFVAAAIATISTPIITLNAHPALHTNYCPALLHKLISAVTAAPAATVTAAAATADAIAAIHYYISTPHVVCFVLD